MNIQNVHKLQTMCSPTFNILMQTFRMKLAQQLNDVFNKPPWHSRGIWNTNYVWRMWVRNKNETMISMLRFKFLNDAPNNIQLSWIFTFQLLDIPFFHQIVYLDPTNEKLRLINPSIYVNIFKHYSTRWYEFLGLFLYLTLFCVLYNLFFFSVYLSNMMGSLCTRGCRTESWESSWR